MHLPMCAQHAMEAGLAGDVDPLVGQHWDDPRRWRLSKPRLVGQRDDACPFGLAQRDLPRSEHRGIIRNRQRFCTRRTKIEDIITETTR
jgi:hypothetical protein